MIKRLYYINGFDCPNCASKVETFLSNDSNISYCHLDFSGNRLYITFKDEEYTIEKLLNLIEQVESDPITLALYDDYKDNKKTKILTKPLWILCFRLLFSLVITIVCLFILAKEGDVYTWVRFSLYLIAVVILIYDIFYRVIVHIIHKENILDHNLLITVAAVGSLALGLICILQKEDSIHQIGSITFAHDDAMEAVMVLFLFQVGHIIERVATNKSKQAIMSAVELRVETASKITESGLIKVSPKDLNVEDTILVISGEMIPLDGVVIEGEGFIDTSSLTGEYIPVEAKSGTNVFGGCLLKSGTLTIQVSKRYEESTVAKILNLISKGNEKKSKADVFIAKFSKFYTPIVVGIAILVFLIGGFITQNQWLKYVSVGLKILVTACPCAIVISVPLSYFSGIGLASKEGIVIKGTNYLDLFANMGKLITDKTGTLTHGSFVISKVTPVGIDSDSFLENIRIVESLSTHPIGKAICHDCDLKKVALEVEDFEEISGKGVKGKFKNNYLLAGSYRFLKDNGIDVPQISETGTVVYLCINNIYKGYLALFDEVKNDAQPMVNLLHHEGVEIILLTGDKEDNAKEICSNLGIDKWHSELLPEDKVNILEQEMSCTKKAVAFIGDGINDAASIIRSDIGIAMGGIGSDIAVENADVVIMNDDPAKVYDAIRISKMARHTAIFNIVFAILVKLIVGILVTIFPDHIDMSIAVLADTGLTVLLVINSLLLLYRKVKRPTL